MVLEYLAETSRAPAPDWMIEYATALARLHSATGPDDVGALPRSARTIPAWPIWPGSVRP
jgi:hypothetical protein